MALAPWALLQGLTQARVTSSNLPSLRESLDELAPGECVACAIPLTGAPVARLLSFALLPLRRWTAERTFATGGAEILGCWGVHPDVESPSCIFDLQSSAATYAGQHLRPRGSKVLLRRVLAAVFGCDPALGAIVIIGRKR
jgi:hypothetical protein